jgi:glycosyltransferase involved in cell wall biosynthesis
VNKISVIVPVYKVEKYLDKCIESIINQTYSNLEIILVDDGSPDNCPKICDNWAKKDNRIKVIHKKNGGLSEARNYGLNEASGNYVGFVDSDDIISQDMYEKMFKLLNDTKADISVCKFKRFKENEVLKFNNNDDDINFYTKDKALESLLVDKLTSHICNKLFKIELFENIEFPIGYKYEDIRTTYKIFEKANLVVETREELYGYLIRNDSITENVTKESITQYMIAVNERYNYFSNKYNNLNYYNDLGLANYIFVYYLKTSNTFNKKLVFCNEMNNEYKKLRKLITKIKLKNYISNENIKTKILKCSLILSPRLFYYLIFWKNNKT